MVIGGSGSGKTTLARLLVWLERADAGEILIDGVDIVKLGERALDRVRKKFAVVFQNYALLDSMSVFENVAFPMREETDFSEVEIVNGVHAALADLEVEEAAEKLPGALSGGMAKRVSIARAIVVEPEMIVYDEPTSRVVDELIERMRTRHGVTSIVITHDMVTAYDVADRVVLLAGGKAIAEGAPESIFESHGPELGPFARSSRPSRFVRSGTHASAISARAGRSLVVVAPKARRRLSHWQRRIGGHSRQGASF